MNRYLLAALVAAAMFFPGTAGAHPLPHHLPFSAMTLDQREHFQLRAIRHATGIVRFWQAHRHLATASEPRVVAWHRAQIRWLRRELKQTRATRQAIAAAASRAAVRASSSNAYTGGSSICGSACVQCESGGNPGAVSPDGIYWGLYQFDYGTWRAHGGSSESYGNASAGVQAAVASRVAYDAWPNC